MPTVRAIPAERTRPLRAEVLRPGQPADATRYPADEAAGSVHFGAFADAPEARADPVGIISLYREARPDRPDDPALRFRGMATAPGVRGHGYGVALIACAIAHAHDEGARWLWCNARTSAAEFYARQGFELQGDEFEIDGIGPHVVMVRRIE